MKLITGFGLLAFAALLEFSPQTQAMELSSQGSKQSESTKSNASTGRVQNLVTNKTSPLVVMVRFADHKGRKLPTKNQLSANMNVQGWVTLPQTEAYYAKHLSNEAILWQALTVALEQIDSRVDLGRFDGDNDGRIDMVTFLHSGYGSHQSDGSDKRVLSHQSPMDENVWYSRQGVMIDNYQIMPLVDVMRLCSSRCVEHTKPSMPKHVNANVSIGRYGDRQSKSVELFWYDNRGEETQVIVERCKQMGKGRHKYCHFIPVANIAAGVSHFSDEPGIGRFKYRLKALSVDSSSAYSNEVEI